jgi:PDZ domain-containing protein
MLATTPPPGGPTTPDPSDGGPPSPLSPRRLWLWWCVGLAGVVVLAIVAAAVVHVPYYLMSPGSTYPTAEHISVEGAPSFEHDDAIYYTTVSVRRATAIQAFVGWLDPTTSVVPERQILGDRTPDENREVNLQQMADAKSVATAVALEELGYEVVPIGTGAVVVGVEDGGAAAGKLERGDVVVAVDGEPVGIYEDLVDELSQRAPGDEVTLTVQPFEGEGSRTEVVALGARPDDPTRPMLGVNLGTRDLSFEFPFEVTIDSGQVGGPSAGLALTLGIIDALSEESITGGLDVATTGTIQLDGTVGPVGGVEQKTVAVRRSGADLFLVPSSELDETRHFAGDLRVEAADSLDEALAVLASMGGAAPTMAPGAEPEG